jgi:hypothetical protein
VRFFARVYNGWLRFGSRKMKYDDDPSIININELTRTWNKMLLEEYGINSIDSTWSRQRQIFNMQSRLLGVQK